MKTNKIKKKKQTKMKTFLFILFCIILSTNAGKVAFRLDDIQDWWLDNLQQMIMEMFQNRSLPLTIGIIGNEFNQTWGIFLIYFSIIDFIFTAYPDLVFDAWVEQFANSPLVEVASHGWNHEDFTTFNLTSQINLMIQSKSRIEYLFPFKAPISTFIPPFNSFNDDTITALSTVGFLDFSSQFDMDVGWTNLNPPYHFPAYGSTDNMDTFVGVNAS